jgi:hypothetical protein
MAGYHASTFRLDQGRYRRVAAWTKLTDWKTPRLLSRFSLLLFAFLVSGLVSRAALQFDPFLGYDGIIPEGCWFPVVLEIKNDGPSFSGIVELNGGDLNKGQTRQIKVELPTGTLKRVVMPMFSTTRNYSTWDVRLLDDRGRVRAEQTGMRPRRQLGREIPLICALSRTASGAPAIRPVLSQQTDAQPAVARLLPQIFPDNPLVLEGMTCLYLNSEIAPQLNVNQADALTRWLYAGGHLIVGVEQVSEVASTPWLKALFPCELKEMRGLKEHTELQEWLRHGTWPTNFHYSSRYRYPGQRNRPAPESSSAAASTPFTELPDDFGFETNEVQVAIGEVIDGRVDVASGDTPLIVTANRGRGRVTALLFSPEREPFRSWKNLPTFWARLAEIPGAWYVSADFNPMGGWSSDGIFGAMIDTHQVHKLPVAWLLLLLIVYLVVIGPFDQFWLKRIGKPMLTWITFPCYVVLFSLVIYLIGYKLRAGETEWNDLHVVDVLVNGDHAELRGRTYSSIYSPSNQRYLLQSQQKYATLRGEFVGGWGGGQSNERGTVLQDGDTFKAEVFVPVWTSQLFVNDWWQPSDMPLNVSVASQGDSWQVKVENLMDQKLTNAQIALEDRIVTLGELPPKETKTFKVTKGEGTPVANYVETHGRGFQGIIQSRQRAFGATESGRIDDVHNSTVAVSFLSKLGRDEGVYGNNFISPPGLDVSSTLEHGNAVLFAWAGDFSPVPPLRQFSPRLSHTETLWRISVPVQ